MSPAYSKTLDRTKDVLSLFYKTYDVDGIKMDGQHFNGVAPDYNEHHHLSRCCQRIVPRKKGRARNWRRPFGFAFYPV